MQDYCSFLTSKMVIAKKTGISIDAEEISDVLKPHQRDAVMWAAAGGRRAIFAAFGLGKTIMQLEWCRLIHEQHGYWRSSGDRPLTKDEVMQFPVTDLQRVYRKYSRESVYNYEEHVAMAEKLDKDKKLPVTFMVVAPGSWTDEVWDDINRMRTMNTLQAQKGKQLHVCPLQFDIVERLIDRYSNVGDLIFDPFGGLMTVPLCAIKRGRRGMATELNADYFRDGVGYLKAEEEKQAAPTLFDFLVGAC